MELVGRAMSLELKTDVKLDVQYLGEYTPKGLRLKNGQKIENPEFSDYSEKILDFKNKTEHAIEYFTKEVRSVIVSEPAFFGPTLVAIPSHKPKSNVTPVQLLIRSLCGGSTNFTDGSDCLIRIKEIEKLASGGPRDIDIHLESIEIDRQKLDLIRDQSVLLIDDVCTTRIQKNTNVK